jgi:hypothetical protein
LVVEQLLLFDLLCILVVFFNSLDGLVIFIEVIEELDALQPR